MRPGVHAEPPVTGADAIERELVRIAEAALADGNVARAVRARATASGLCRAAGDTEAAAAHLHAVRRIVCSGDAAAALALEEAELALVDGDVDAALRHLADALAQAESAPVRGRCVRLRARVAAASQWPPAVSRHRPVSGAIPDPRAVLDPTLAAVGQRLAEAVASGDPQLMIDVATELRRHALDTDDPGSYSFAAGVESLAAEALGDDLRAYTSLATAYVTVLDIGGRDAASQLVEPWLIYLLEVWGQPKFESVKRRHDEERRRHKSSR